METTTQEAAHAPQERFRAVYIPQVPMAALTIETSSLEHAVIALESVVALSIFEFDNRVKPDYSDLALIERWDPECAEWEDLDEDEWEHLREDLVTIGDTHAD